jgi:hypothetical protein
VHAPSLEEAGRAWMQTIEKVSKLVMLVEKKEWAFLDALDRYAACLPLTMSLATTCPCGLRWAGWRLRRGLLRARICRR